ncbi:MAG TPA: response regulator [Archangium sp.]|nr:response regulator [Archangium sp.]
MAFDDFDALLQEDGARETPTTSEKPRVVIIDDDPGIRRSLALLLSDSYQVRLYASALEGVTEVDDEVCAVILDIKMKGHDGFWACNEIRKTQPDMPVIFYSAYQDVKDPYEVINEHRPFGYLSKDSGVRRLLDTLETAVRLRKLAMENRKQLEALKSQRSPRRG